MKHLRAYIQDPNNAIANWNLALEYESLGHIASAFSFFMRAAEKATDPNLSYEALLRMGLCFERLSQRPHSTRGLYQHAIDLLPNRPEGYFLLSRYHERCKEYRESCMIATVGMEILRNISQSPPKLRTDVEYPGYYGIQFERAVSSWWNGQVDLSKHLFADLNENHEMSDMYTNSVIYNMTNIGMIPETIYKQKNHHKLRFKFPGSESIQRNYAQSYQDMFVLAALNGKTDGSYLEIGSAEPFYHNNTALLATKFGWEGVSLDFNSSVVEEFRQERSTTCLHADATTIDYLDLLRTHFGDKREIDYLQIDLEPPEISMQVLKMIPFSAYKFATITFEHDSYRGTSFKEESREFLQSYGYVLVVPDVEFMAGRSYEDWWVHPSLVSQEIMRKMMDSEGRGHLCSEYMTKY